MKKVYIDIIIIAFLLSFKCSDNSDKGKVSFNNFFSGKKSWDEIFIKVGQIYPESKPEFYLSAYPEIWDIDDNGNYLVLDNANMRQILIFDKNGKAIKKIGKVGRGPGEYLYPESAYYSDSLIYVNDSDLLRLTIFNSNYQFLNSITLPIPFADIRLHENRIWGYRTNMQFHFKSNNIIFEIDENGKILTEFHKQSNHYSIAAESKGGGFIIIDNFFYVTVPYEYKISKYNKNGVLLKETFGSSQYFTPPSQNIDAMEITSDIKKHIQFHRTWGPILQIFEINNIIAIIYQCAPNNGGEKYIDFYDKDLNLLLNEIKMPFYISKLFAKDQLIYLFKKSEYDSIENASNPSIVVYQMIGQVS